MQFAGKYADRGSEMGQQRREEGMKRAAAKREAAGTREEKVKQVKPEKPRSERGKSAAAASRTGVAPGKARSAQARGGKVK